MLVHRFVFPFSAVNSVYSIKKNETLTTPRVTSSNSLQGCVCTQEFQNLRNSVGRAMVQAASRQPFTAEAWARARLSPFGICGEQSGTGSCFSPSSSVLTCQYHSTVALHTSKMCFLNTDQENRRTRSPSDTGLIRFEHC
jgi:hypothetical protein